MHDRNHLSNKPPKLDEPANAAWAQQLLEEGNHAFAELLVDADLTSASRRVLPFDPSVWQTGGLENLATAEETLCALRRLK